MFYICVVQYGSHSPHAAIVQIHVTNVTKDLSNFNSFEFNRHMLWLVATILDSMKDGIY